MDDARILEQATACVTSCLAVSGPPAQKKKLLESLIAVARTKLQSLDHIQLTQARRDYLRASTTDPNLVGLIDTVEVVHHEYQRLDYHVTETLSLTVNGSPMITAFYNGDNEGEGTTIMTFEGIEGEDTVSIWLLLYHLRSCLGLNEAVPLSALAIFLQGMVGQLAMIDGTYCHLPDTFDQTIVLVKVDQGIAGMTTPSQSMASKRDRTQEVEYQCPLRDLERLLRVAVIKDPSSPRFKADNVLLLRLPNTSPRGPFAKVEKLETFPSLLATPLATALLG